MRKHGGDLEAPNQAKPRHLSRLHPGNVATIIANGAARRRQEFRQHIEASGLAGAVRADQAMDGAPTDLQVYVADRDEAPKFLGKPFRFKDGVRHPNHAPLLAAVDTAKPLAGLTMRGVAFLQATPFISG